MKIGQLFSVDGYGVVVTGGASGLGLGTYDGFRLDGRSKGRDARERRARGERIGKARRNSASGGGASDGANTELLSSGDAGRSECR